MQCDVMWDYYSGINKCIQTRALTYTSFFSSVFNSFIYAWSAFKLYCMKMFLLKIFPCHDKCAILLQLNVKLTVLCKQSAILGKWPTMDWTRVRSLRSGIKGMFFWSQVQYGLVGGSHLVAGKSWNIICYQQYILSTWGGREVNLHF